MCVRDLCYAHKGVLTARGLSPGRFYDRLLQEFDIKQKSFNLSLALEATAPPNTILPSVSFNIRTDSRSTDTDTNTDTADNMDTDSTGSHTRTGRPEEETRQSQKRSAVHDRSHVGNQDESLDANRDESLDENQDGNRQDGHHAAEQLRNP